MTITLPHSGLTVPHTELHVSHLHEMPVAEGVAFTAELRLGPTPVGTAENDGHGGATCYQPYSARHQPGRTSFTAADMDDFAARCRLSGERVDTEQVLDCLINEYDFARQAAHAAQHGLTLARKIIQGRYPVAIVPVYPPTTPHERARLAADLASVPAALPDQDGRWELWDGQRWTALSAAAGALPDRPRSVVAREAGDVNCTEEK